MHISERDGVFTAQNVTGPTHNFLRLKLNMVPRASFL